MTTITMTPAQDAILVELFIDAPPARVFQAITDPAQLLQWWGQEGMYRTTGWQCDLRVGGSWRSEGVGADGSPFRVRASTWKSTGRAYWFTPGSPAGPPISKPQSVGNSRRRTAARC